MKKIRNLCAVVLALGVAVTADAQDLQSQRGESQDVGKILGHKVDHGGLIINPTPQQLTRRDGAVADISSGVALCGAMETFKDDVNFLDHNAEGLKLALGYAEGDFGVEGMPLKSGAYILDIAPEGINITAFDELGAFYALQTLRQVVESPIAAGGTLPAMTINDWPDLKYRGVVEGFYGIPWSHQTRLSLIDIYGRYKMNYYIYGPKDDPYHSSPYWREEYPEDEAKELHELVEACKRNRVHFVWAIHPGKDIRWDEEDYNNLLNKFEAMYGLGVRAFAIHFDDIEGVGAHPLRQTELANRLTEEFVKAKGDVEPLIVCPTEYTRLWANPTERGSLVLYGNTLDPEVDVFWTGDAVCSNLTESTMEWVGSRIQRPALFWWNFPVTDYARHIVMQGPVYGLSTTMDETKTRGIVSNPMEHGEASKLALYSTADYAWNVEAYNAIDSWERAIESVAPEVKDAYRLFAIHSCDTETGYRRVESWETETFLMDEYTEELAAKLKAELELIVAVPEKMEAMENKALLEELRPWLVEFAKLGTRCLKAIEALELYRAGEYEAFWQAYVENLMSEADIEAFDAHRVGTMKLHPFYERLMDAMAAAYYEQLSGQKSSTLKAAGSYTSLAAPQAKYMFDNDDTTYYHSGQGQRTDDFVAADMGIVREVREVRIIQGRNSVDDVDYFDHVIVEYSADGEQWTALTEPLVGVYDIVWKGEPFEARYVGIRKLESQKRNWLAIRAFEINPVEESEYGADGNPFTVLVTEGEAQFAVTKEQSKGRCVALLGTPTDDAKYRVLNKRGKVIREGAIETPYVEIANLKGAASIEFEGVNNVFEVMFLPLL
ncbi:MAG: beta-N-acetylglucosaminidase domain-containing protein [Alistipes sp.]|nr:beta-N-acetylglucosaminidase domain-containing protein [Alistipes sp.]